MANHYARTRRNRGAWYEALQVDQAIATGHPIDDIRDFDEAVTSGATAHVLVAADNPAPARGYMLIIHTGDAAYARMHVLDKETDEVYRALMSQARVQIDYLTQRTGTTPGLPILVDTEMLATPVSNAVERLGAPYGVLLNNTGEADGSTALDVLESAASQSIADQTADALAHGIADTGSAAVRSATEPLMHTVTLISFTPGDDSDHEEHAIQVEHGEPLPAQPTPEPVNGHTFEAWVNGHDFKPYDFTEPVTENREITQAWIEPGQGDAIAALADAPETTEQAEADQADASEASDATQAAHEAPQVPDTPQADNTTPPAGETHTCTEFGCTKTFGTARGLKIHTNTHTK